MTSWVLNLALGLALAALIGLELRDPGFRAASFGRDRSRTRRNLSFLTAAVGVAFLLRAVEPALRQALGVSPWGGGSWLGAGLNLLACALVAELVGWCLHYVKHAAPLLWRLHFQHHQETRYDVWLVTHTHGLEVLVSGSLLLIVLVGLGFSSASVQAYFAFYAVANTWQHSSRDLSLGPLDAIIVSPAYHRYHHAVGATGEVGVNFGNTLVVWDRIFGTARFPEGRRQPDVPVGIPAGPEPYGFWAEMTWFLEPVEPIEPEPELPAAAPLPRGASTF